uniref:TTN1 n=1 Tax=Arundo donax TaxID=35708 RepID=A0A0A9ENH9_ARUDO
MVPGTEAAWLWLNLLEEGCCCLLAFLMLFLL